MTKIRTVGVLLIVWLGACRHAAPGPAALDTRADTCAVCRMLVSDRTRASQIAAPAEEPRFFDDASCLISFLKKTPALSPDARIYVADRSTGAWTEADRGSYTRAEVGPGTMGSR